MMKTMKKIFAICLVASIAAVTFGCSDGKNEVRETISLEDTKQELQFYYNNNDVEDSTEAPQKETSAETAEPATEVVTEFIDVTDEQGQQVTEEGGAVQTEVHTEVVTVPAETPTEPEYKASYDTCKAYWLDMTQEGDYTFNGEFLIISFEIKEKTPDGNYPITISKTDIGSWDVVTRVPECINGEISVGNAKPSAQKEADAEKFTLTVKNAAGNPGDVVDVVIDMKNNPGFCGFVIDVQYDTNALTIVETSGGADFDAAVKYVP